MASNKYGEIAIQAVKEYDGDARASWSQASKNFYFDKPYAASKGCPRTAFLGLCEEGLVKNIQKGNYLKANTTNKKYAIAALKLLRACEDNYTSIELWKAIKAKTKHNNQMDVVIALYRVGYLK